MKNFLKTLLAVICGLLIVNLIGFWIIASVASIGGKAPAIPTQGVLRVDMSKIIVAEQSTQSFNFSQKDYRVTIGLLKAMNAIAAAAEDPGVKCIYLKTDGLAIGTGAIQEFRKALSVFRQSGKPVIAYMENPTTGSYYLASVADKVYMGAYQGGTPTFTGLSSQMMFLGDVLSRLGINVQLIRHGKYKSAGEMYIRSSASAENLYQNQVMVNSLWSSFVDEMADSRGLTPKDINDSIDNLELCLPADFVSAGLVDELLDRNALEAKLAVMAQVEDYDEVQFIPFDAYADSHIKNNFRAAKRIAVIYANGSIVDGYDVQNVDGDRFASIIEDVRKDDMVKAVVLRVNSPGGSVVASEKIRHELDRLAEEKPLIASYGDYAASGGYWISNGADRIFSDATTLTGSIGVFGMVPDLSKLYKETLHVGVQSVSSNKHGDMFAMGRAFTKEELAYMQRSIESIYTRFVGLVSEGRDMTVQQVDEIAQGRVWTGSDAVKIGLVDEIGGLNEAMAYAAVSGGDSDLSNWNIVEYPRELTLIEMLTESFTGAVNDYSVFGNWANYYKSWYESFMGGNREMVFATMPYIPSIIK